MIEDIPEQLKKVNCRTCEISFYYDSYEYSLSTFEICPHCHTILSSTETEDNYTSMLFPTLDEEFS